MTPSDPQYVTQGQLADLIGKIIDRLKPVNQETPMTWVRWGILVALAIIASWRGNWKDDIVIPPPPVAQTAPQVYVVQVPANTSVAEVAKQPKP